MSIASVNGLGSAASSSAYRQQNLSGNFQEVLASVSGKQKPGFNVKAETATAASSSSQPAKTGGGSASVDLTADLKNARESGRKLSDETRQKLFSTDTETFIEGVSEATGRTPAQVMSAFLNMNASQASAFCKSLGLSTDSAPEAFVPMVSKLTGHPEAMMKQYLNGEDDEEEDGKEKARQEKVEQDNLKTAKTLDYQRGFFQTTILPTMT